MQQSRGVSSAVSDQVQRTPDGHISSVGKTARRAVEGLGVDIKFGEVYM